jgi:hypothetical protein
MSNEVKKYRWNFHNEVEYTIEEYISKVHELVYSAITQMQECDGDLFMSEYRNLVDGVYKLDYLNDQLNGEGE